MISLTTAVQQRIVNLANERNITVHKLATLSGLSYSTISSFMKGKCDSITMTTLLHICEGSGIGLVDFFSDPLFEPFNKNYKKRKKKASAQKTVKL